MVQSARLNQRKNMKTKKYNETVLLRAAKKVIANWEIGDLAEAVRELDRAVKNVEEKGVLRPRPVPHGSQGQSDANAGQGRRGRWNPERKLWFAKYGEVVGTLLEKYIQVDNS
jgi:hypothetical protein